jgi:hypothetical protein
LQQLQILEVRDLIFLGGFGTPTQNLHLLASLSSVLGFFLKRFNGLSVAQIEHFFSSVLRVFLLFMFPIYETRVGFFFGLRFFWLRFFGEFGGNGGRGWERVIGFLVEKEKNSTPGGFG